MHIVERQFVRLWSGEAQKGQRAVDFIILFFHPLSVAPVGSMEALDGQPPPVLLDVQISCSFGIDGGCNVRFNLTEGSTYIYCLEDIAL